MAGEFKAFDTIFAAHKGKTLDTISKEGGRPAREDIEKESWYKFMSGWEYVIHGREDVRNAVYRASGFEDWQKFRVGLHGLSTQEKLYCLAWYYAHNREKGYTVKIRVDNYLGALVRGGQLNDKLEIVR